MGTYHKPIDLYMAQMKRLNSSIMSMREGHEQLAIDGYEDARELTSGTLTPKQTRGAFARGATPAQSTPTGRRRTLTPRQRANRGIGKGGVPLLPINIQSSKLHDSFRIIRVSGTASGQTFELTQVDPGGGIYRLQPGGTKKMVDSGYETEIRKRWKARNTAFLDHWRNLMKTP